MMLKPRQITPIDKSLGKVLRDLRTVKGMQQHDVATHLGITAQQVSKYENGKSRFVVAYVFAFAVLVNAKPEDIVKLARIEHERVNNVTSG